MMQIIQSDCVPILVRILGNSQGHEFNLQSGHALMRLVYDQPVDPNRPANVCSI